MTAPDLRELTYGTLRWWVIGFDADTAFDSDDLPDIYKVNGKAYLSFDVDGDGLYLQETTTPVTVLKKDLELDIVNGRLQDKAGHTDIKVLGNDSPGLSQVGWTYTIRYELDDGVSFGDISFELAGGQTLDLTMAVPLGSPSPGVVITKGQKGDPGPGYGGGLIVTPPADINQPLELQIRSNWGINALGVVYYDDAGAASGEDVMLMPDPYTGKWTIFKNDGAGLAAAKTPSYTTGTLPTPVDAGKGGSVWDDTAKRPKWSDGTQFYEAAPSDASAAIASLRTLGTGAQQAAAGNHTHPSSQISDATDAATPNTVVRRDTSGGIGAAYVYGLGTPGTSDGAAPKGYVDTGLAGKVDTTRQIIDGDGLTGGGDLSANRTLSVVYGSTVRTSVQGNDPRVTADQAAAIASIRTLGTGAQQAAAGNHTHSGLTADQAAGTASIRTLGTGATQAAAGNHTHTADGLSDATPTGKALIRATDAAAARSATGAPLGTGISEVRALTQAAYDALGTKSATTLYVING